MSDIGKNRVDIAGKVYGNLTVIALEDKEKGKRSRKWRVGCSACKSEALFDGSILRAGKVTSCGCRPRLNMRGFALIERMKASGQRLCKSLPDSASANPEVRFFLEPSGRTVNKTAAESAIAAHEVVPAGDGLFADQSQTWVTP